MASSSTPQSSGPGLGAARLLKKALSGAKSATATLLSKEKRVTIFVDLDNIKYTGTGASATNQNNRVNFNFSHPICMTSFFNQLRIPQPKKPYMELPVDAKEGYERAFEQLSEKTRNSFVPEIRNVQDYYQRHQLEFSFLTDDQSFRKYFKMGNDALRKIKEQNLRNFVLFSEIQTQRDNGRICPELNYEVAWSGKLDELKDRLNNSPAYKSVRVFFLRGTKEESGGPKPNCVTQTLQRRKSPQNQKLESTLIEVSSGSEEADTWIEAYIDHNYRLIASSGLVCSKVWNEVSGDGYNFFNFPPPFVPYNSDKQTIKKRCDAMKNSESGFTVDGFVVISNDNDFNNFMLGWERIKKRYQTGAEKDPVAFPSFHVSTHPNNQSILAYNWSDALPELLN